jgi:oligopeptide/dipeptide ABC transporter ATP-binding protein
MAIELMNVKKHYLVRAGGLLTWRATVLRAVDGVTFTIQEGKTTALIGESGCGKTTIAKLILRLETPTNGKVYFDGKDIQFLKREEVAKYRRSAQAVFQNPYASLNPRMRIGDTIAEPAVANRLMSRKEVQERVVEVLRQVGLGNDSAYLYPHEFSGGQRQRIAIARALASSPRFIVLDEPVSALDVSIRAQIMNLLKGLQGDLGLGYLLIAHDLATAVYLSDWIEIIYAGKVVETLSAGELYHGAVHPYTKALLRAASPAGLRNAGGDSILHGEIPDPLNLPPGCAFHPRCPFKMPKCSKDEPLLKIGVNKQAVRCHLFS